MAIADCGVASYRLFEFLFQFFEIAAALIIYAYDRENERDMPNIEHNPLPLHSVISPSESRKLQFQDSPECFNPLLIAQKQEWKDAISSILIHIQQYILYQAP